jgi:hypothetical protein
MRAVVKELLKLRSASGLDTLLLLKHGHAEEQR